MRVPVSPRFPALPAVTLPHVVLSCGALVAFATYGFFAARYVGGCDSWAYLSDSLALRGRNIGFNGGLDPAAFPAVVPLCYDLIGRKVVSMMPPGFPVLLALAGLLRAQFWVSPFLGALSGVLLFEAVRRRCNAWIALAFAAIWATSSIVVWGSTQLMSDMAATTFALLAFVLAESARGATSGAVLGFSFGIRPTNVLVLPGLLAARSRSFGLGRFCAGLGLALFFWIVFAFTRYGRLIPEAYTNQNAHPFSTEHALYQLGFFARTTFGMFWPVVPLSLFGVYRRPRQSLPLVLWCVAYVGLYAFWRYPFTAWWWTRYLLPAYPPLFILSAQGTAELSDAARRSGFGSLPVRAFFAIAVLLVCGRSVTYGQNHDLYNRAFDRGYSVDSRLIAKAVPRDTLVAAANFSGPLRLYGGLESFMYDHPRALELIDAAMKSRRPVYAVIDPPDFDGDPNVRELRRRFILEDVAPLSTWDGLMLRRIVPRSGNRVDLLLGTRAARPFLREGWSGDEFDEKRHWVWAIGPRSSLEVPLEPGHGVLMTLVLAPFAVPGRQQQVTVVVNGAEIASIVLAGEMETRFVQLPGRVVRAANLIELRYAYAASPKELGLSADERELSVVVQRLSFSAGRPSP